MPVMIVQIQSGEPVFFESGKTVMELKSKLDIDGQDPEGFIEDINNSDLSGVNTKFEIRCGVWILFC